MSWFTLVDQALTNYGYVAVAVGIGVECIGVPLPGETILLAAGAYAGATGHLSTVLVVLVAAAAAVVGDNVGFLLGRRYGARWITSAGARTDRRGAALSAVRDMYDRYGSYVVVAGRFVSVLRTYAALGAGATGMRWRRFSLLNLLGAAGWATSLGFGSAALGKSVGTVGSYAIMGVVLLGTAGVALILRRQRRGASTAGSAPGHSVETRDPALASGGSAVSGDRGLPAGDPGSAAGVDPREHARAVTVGGGG